MSDPTTPQFYQKPVALNIETHAALTISPSPDGYRFTAGSQFVLLATVEFFEAGRQFPIVFAQASGNKIFPVALLGLEQHENLFVDAQGKWLAHYIPAYIRRYPFITSDDAEGRMTVCFDEDFGGFNQDGGAALFDHGEPTAKLTEIQTLLQDYHQQMQQTEQFCARLIQLGLLRQVNAQTTLADGRSYSLNGMLVVDEQRLRQLPDTDIIRLFHSGKLGLIQAHLLSLRNLTGLMDRKTKIAGTGDQAGCSNEH